MLIILFRTLIVYAFLMLLLRLLGKRQLGEMELSEFVVAALIADLAANALEENRIPLLQTLLPILILSVFELITAWLSMRSVRLRSLLFGRPSLLIDHGCLNQAEMRRNRFTPDELMQALRGQGILDLGQVLYAVLETNGTLSVIPAAGCQPVTASQMGLSPEDAAYPSIVISDGRVIDENLRRLGFDRVWLDRQLKARKLSAPREVFLMTADESGTVFLAPRENDS